MAAKFFNRFLLLAGLAFYDKSFSECEKSRVNDSAPRFAFVTRSTPRSEQTNRLRIIHQTQKPHRKGDCRRFYLITWSSSFFLKTTDVDTINLKMRWRTFTVFDSWLSRGPLKFISPRNCVCKRMSQWNFVSFAVSVNFSHNPALSVTFRLNPPIPQTFAGAASTVSQTLSALVCFFCLFVIIFLLTRTLAIRRDDGFKC